jgi:hypothetical protein
MCMPDRDHCLTPTEHVGRGLSSAPHFLHSGLSINPIKWRCLRRVLCPVRSPVTTLDCTLPKDKNLTLVPRLGPDINYRACRELPSSCHRLCCWFPSQRPILKSCFETPQGGLRPYKPSGGAAAHDPFGSFIASHPCLPGDPIKSHSMPGGDVI